MSNLHLDLISFVLQCCSPWVGMQRALHASSPSTFRGRIMMDAPPRAEMTVTAGVPLPTTTTATKPLDSALKQVGGVIQCLLCHTMLITQSAKDAAK